MRRLILTVRWPVFCLLLSHYGVAWAQPASPTTETSSQAAPTGLVTFTAQEDHADMLRQLGISKLRPGPSGNAEAANAANYDETQANPFPNWPELLTCGDGSPVASAEQWWSKRRPEIVELFEREVYGRIPSTVPAVQWTVKENRQSEVAGIAVTQQHIVGAVDNSACPEISVEISMSLTLPKQATGPVPVLMMFGRTEFDPMPEWMQRFNRERATGGNQAGPRGPQGPSRTDELIAAGWGYAMLNPSSIQADNGAGLTRGIIGLVNCGQPRSPEDWGALRAWGWGASRGLDYLLTNATVDAQRIGIEGVSRYGKAALVTMAFDERFAMVLIGSSGAGGATPHRRNFGEAVENLAGSGEYHWMAGNFLKYAADESQFGKKTAADIPVDSHQLIALCAPRQTFVSYGIPEKGDANWLDQRGSFMATVAASPVFELLGVQGLGVPDDYRQATLPPVNSGLLEGRLAWRQHDGGHTDAPNMQHFINWSNTHADASTTVTSKPADASSISYDAKLATQLGADKNGMKTFVFVLLKTGSVTITDPDQSRKIFAGHFANMTRLAQADKLVLAGPFVEGGEKRGLFILNVTTLEEAEELVKSDPAVQAGVFEYELTQLYCSAALMKIGEIHESIQQPNAQ